MNILLLNGGKAFGHSGGRLNRTLHDTAQTVLTAKGHAIRETQIDEGYDVAEEIDKFLWMDAVIWQMPGWWMHEPWTVKKYMDEVFTAGHGKLYQSDGRHRETPTEDYGTGGLLQGRQHMLSLTWNAPREAFERPGDFFEGVGGGWRVHALSQGQRIFGHEAAAHFHLQRRGEEPASAAVSGGLSGTSGAGV
ncbi:MAG: NAD(P)H-dependent oxidoreductase [Brachymonas sp.]|nr:NAD(P)H-dependent oxidoreductase [Brachymonas sp.]